MSELIDGLEFIHAHIDDLLCLTKGTFEEHPEKVELVLQRLQKAGLNVMKSIFAHSQLEQLGYWITRTGIKPVLVCEKVKAVMKIAEPKTQKEL